MLDRRPNLPRCAESHSGASRRRYALPEQVCVCGLLLTRARHHLSSPVHPLACLRCAPIALQQKKGENTH